MKPHTILNLLLAGALALAAVSCASTGSTAGPGGTKPYPLDTCIVTGSTLGSMGDPVTKVYNGQQVKFCCSSCIKKFDAEPAKYLSQLP